MKEFKGTKGPWYWDDEGLGNKTMLVFGKNYPVEMTSKENKALIAAAPDLLELVMKSNHATSGSHTAAWQQKAKQAVAKALGETK